MPYEELPHTADWCLRVWAADLSLLFAEAARGMNTISGMQTAPGPVIHRTLDLSTSDAESLLVAFLSELVYAAEQERVMFTSFDISMVERSDGWKLRVEMDGAPLTSVSKNIKAVTYHNLHIRQSERGLEVEIVFDV